MHRLSLPGIFWRDHYDRCGDNPGQRIIRHDGKNRVIVYLDDEALADLKSDAEYYITGVDFAGERFAYRSLIDSAKATIFAIKRQMPEWVSPWDKRRQERKERNA